MRAISEVMEYSRNMEVRTEASQSRGVGAATAWWGVVKGEAKWSGM